MTSTLPRYLTKRKQADGLEHYRFNPLQKYIDIGIVKRMSLGSNKQRALQDAEEMNALIDEYESFQTINNKSTLKDLYNNYIQSNDFSLLREKTQKDYVYNLKTLLESDYMGKIRLSSITTPMIKKAYEKWVKRGISFANHVMAVANTLFSYAIEMGYIQINPCREVKRKMTNAERIIWTNDEVKQFLNVAYSDFKHRSIGLIVHMAYEWGQRIGDMRLLEWENIQFDSQRLYLKQSKKRKEVFLPINDNLFRVLQKQHSDFGFQQYVAPRPYPINDEYRPYLLQNVSKAGKKVMDIAGLRSELQLMHLRATAITEMNDSGVGINQIMSVSGHSNPQSVKPYIKHTFDSANYALEKRNEKKDLTGLQIHDTYIVTADKESVT
jgi:integrase